MDGQTLPVLIATCPAPAHDNSHVTDIGDVSWSPTPVAWLLITPLLALPDDRHDWPTWWQGIEYVMLRWLADQVDTLDPSQVTWQITMAETSMNHGDILARC